MLKLKRSKGSIITLIVLLSAISIALIGFMVFVICTSNIIYAQSDTLTVNRSFKGQFSELDIYAEQGDVYIYSTKGKRIKVKVFSKKNKASVEQNGDKLTLKVDEESNFMFFWQKSSRIEFYIPEGYDGMLKINDNYGDIKLEKFLKASVDINEKCGDVNIAGCNDVKVDNNYGDIKIEKINSYMKLNNNCGDIEVNEVNLTKDSIITDSLGDISIGYTNEIFINAKTDLGDVKINKNYYKSDIELSILNNCGSIRVNN